MSVTIISEIYNILSFSTAVLVAKAVISSLDYRNSLLYNVNKTSISEFH